MILNNPLVNDYPMKLKPALVRWALPGWSFHSKQAGLPLVNGDIVYEPIFVSEETTFIRVGCEVTTAGAGGSTLEIRLFAWEDGVPGALIEDFGNVSLAAIAQVEIVISTTLARGYYFLAYRTATGVNAVLEVPLITASVVPPIPGLGVAPGGIARPLLGVTSAWADPAPAPTTVLPFTWVGVQMREN